MRPPVLAIFLLAAPVGAGATTVQLSYDGTLAGVRVVQAQATLHQDDAGYLLRMGVHSVGVFARIARGRSDVVAQGVWQGLRAVPTHVDSEGFWNGRPHRLVMDYADGQPQIRVQVPQPAADKPARPGPADLADTIDALGLVAGLIRAAQTTHGCAAARKVFDGRGVTRFAMKPAAPDADAAGGAAMRCDFTLQKVVSFADKSPRKPAGGYAIFASPGPGLPVVPVRLVFTGSWAGDAALQLTSAQLLAANVHGVPP